MGAMVMLYRKFNLTKTRLQGTLGCLLIDQLD